MVAASAVFISHKQSGTIPDGGETTSAMIANELRYMKTRLKVYHYIKYTCSFIQFPLMFNTQNIGT